MGNNFRSSFGRFTQNNRYNSRPSNGRCFGGHSNNRFGGFRRRNESKLLGKDERMFICKAQEFTPIEDTISQHQFTDFNIVDILKQNIASRGYKQPTPIQDQAIKPILEGRDLIGLANTGTGKTAAFLIPLINKIYQDRQEKALIIVPTRELALQIDDEFYAFTKNMNVYSTMIIGGKNISRQIRDLRRNPNVVIGTPGRLKDLVERRVLFLEDFTTIILDEVDLMVDIGFINDVKYFISLLPKERQSLFFSATISPKIQEVLRDFVTNPVTVSVKQQDTAQNIDQDVIRVSGGDKKIDILHDLLIRDGFDKVLVFGKTKHGVEKLNKELEFRGFRVGAIHGNKKQGQRQRTLEDFKRNEIQILLATDVASRGLDIDNVTHVINYDLPDTYEDYIHRIGRTGRANKKGVALTFIEQSSQQQYSNNRRYS